MSADESTREWLSDILGDGPELETIARAMESRDAELEQARAELAAANAALTGLSLLLRRMARKAVRRRQDRLVWCKRALIAEGVRAELATARAQLAAQTSRADRAIEANAAMHAVVEAAGAAVEKWPDIVSLHAAMQTLVARLSDLAAVPLDEQGGEVKRLREELEQATARVAAAMAVVEVAGEVVVGSDGTGAVVGDVARLARRLDDFAAVPVDEQAETDEEPFASDTYDPCPDCGTDPDEPGHHREGCRRIDSGEYQFGPPWKAWPGEEHGVDIPGGAQ